MSEATRTKLIGGLVLVVTGWGLYQILKLTNEPVKKSEKLDGVDETLRDYRDLTENNDHTGAALILAKNYGTKKDVKTIEAIQKRQNKRGHISNVEKSIRDRISNRLYYALKNKKVK